MNTAGYSGTPLAKKLGIKDGHKIAFINVPENYFELFNEMPSITIIKNSKKKKDLIHYFVKEQKQKMADAETAKRQKFPTEPQRDVLKFLLQYAPLEDWQQYVLTIIRDEAYYFAPQGMTKTMNEGWASYWHSKLMT